MKKLIIAGLVIIVVITGYHFYSQYQADTHNNVIDYYHIVNHSSQDPLTTSTSNHDLHNLTAMLESGINTSAGLIQSTTLNPSSGIAKYSLNLNDKPLGLTTVSPIELVRGFMIEDKQVMLLGFDLGGNQCSRKYVMVTIGKSANSVKISKPFGSCLPLTEIREESTGITIIMPQNNPYLGDEFTLSYRYSAGKVSEISKPHAEDIKQKFSKLTASSILKIAASDGCYQDGVMLDDNSCANGLKYCTMFKNIAKKSHNRDYKFLHDFCTQ